MFTAVEFASRLIEFNSVSHLSNVAVTDQVEEWLRGLGFACERLTYLDAAGVCKTNIIGKLGTGTGGLGYFAHTDVVPADDWAIQEHGPFTPIVKEAKLFGRGSTDMRGSIGCLLAAVSLLSSRTFKQPLYFCCTADEEVGMQGAIQVAAESALFKEMVEHHTPSIIGEPTKLEVVYGHKGGCAFKATSYGIAGHSSTRHGVNANWKMIPFLSEMKALYEELETDPKWRNAEFDPPTMTLNLGINDHMQAINVTPPQSVCTVFFRPVPGVDITPIIERCAAAAKANDVTFELRVRSEPMYVDPNSPFVQQCLEFVSSPQPKTVSYGTDGSKYGALKQMVVLGPGSISQAHTNNEWIELDQLNRGTDLYRRMIEKWCLS